jgi:Cys-rich protein (TIGR01571 family)
MNIQRLDWEIKLLDWEKNKNTILISLIPFSCCVLQGIAVNRATLDNAFLHGLIGVVPGIGSGYNRYLIRQRYHLKGDYFTDCFLSLLLCLSAAQEYKEVEFREARMKSINKPHLKNKYS